MAKTGSRTVPTLPRERPAVHCRYRRSRIAPAAEEFGAVGFNFGLADCLSLNDGKMCGPGLGLARRSQTPLCQQDAGLGVVFGLNEQLGEGGMGRVGCGRRQYQLGVGGDFDFAGPEAVVRHGYTACLGIVFRRYHDLERRRDRPVAPGELPLVFAERDVIAVRLDAAGLVACGPYVAAAQIAEEDIRSPVVAGRVLAPTGNRDIAPSAIPGAGCREHDGIAAVRKQMD
jgi:hypothetical protein